VTFLRLLIALSLFGGSVFTARALHQRVDDPAEATHRMVYLPPAWLAQLSSLGHPTLAADYYWVQGLQYYGHEPNRAVHYRDLHRFVDLVVTLDPRYESAYRFGGIAVPYNAGRWDWQNAPAAVDILERGVEHFPDNWIFWMQLGFLKGTIQEDWAGAAQAYRRGAETPAAPPWVPRLVTRLLSTSGSLEAAETYALGVIESTSDPELREVMTQRILELRVEGHLRALDRALKTYRERSGVAAPSLDALVEAGLLLQIPQEPLGGRYELQEGQPISTSLHKGRLRVYEDHK